MHRKRKSALSSPKKNGKTELRSRGSLSNERRECLFCSEGERYQNKKAIERLKMVLTTAAVDDFADDPHKETTVARQTRNHNTTRTLLTYLLKRSPFNKMREGNVNIIIGHRIP